MKFNLSIKHFLLIFLCGFYMLSCSRKCPCLPADTLIQIVSFSNTESDSIIVKRFIKGSNFQTIYDSVLLDSSNCKYIKLGDTIQLPTSSLTGHITSSFDYEIYIPAVNKLTRISEITEQADEGRVADASTT